MSTVQFKEQQVLAFLKKCDELIKRRAQLPNFDEIADQYLGEGESMEDEIDNMISHSQSYSLVEQQLLQKLKVSLYLYAVLGF